MSKEHNEHHHQKNHGSVKRGLHKSPWLWAIVLLMLAAMAVYVMTMDEAIRPGQPVGQPVPAAP